MNQKKKLCVGCAAMLLLSVVLLLFWEYSLDVVKLSKKSTIEIESAAPTFLFLQKNVSGLQHPVFKVYEKEKNTKTKAELSFDEVFEVEEEIEAPEFPLQLYYKQYPLTYTYVVCGCNTVSIHKLPSLEAGVLRKTQKWEKLQYLETVRFFNNEKEGETKEQGTCWYHVYWYEDSEKRVIADGNENVNARGKITSLRKVFGFVNANAVSKRNFAFFKMQEEIKRLETAMQEGSLTYVSNYKNYNGLPPLCNGKEKDKGGIPRSQSAPAYLREAKTSEFIYLPDGTLVRSMESANGFCHVMLVQNGNQYFIPEKYIPQKEVLKKLSKIIAIDRKNQNIACFEKNQDLWQLVSYSLVTTGTKNAYAQPTPLGCYFVIEKRPQFWYCKDGTKEIQGYAPYTLRFCGGAYLHGLSVAYQWENGNRIDPGIREFSSSVGTRPLSHKCVRNYTSHAKFLYDWYSNDEMAVLVIEP